jgi:hypothetical protein
MWLMSLDRISASSFSLVVRHVLSMHRILEDLQSLFGTLRMSVCPLSDFLKLVISVVLSENKASSCHEVKPIWPVCASFEAWKASRRLGEGLDALCGGRARKCTKFTESVTYGRGEMETIATAMQVTQRFY